MKRYETSWSECSSFVYPIIPITCNIIAFCLWPWDYQESMIVKHDGSHDYKQNGIGTSIYIIRLL